MTLIPSDIIICTNKMQKSVIEEIKKQNTNDFKITYMVDSYRSCINKIKKLKSVIVIFQLAHPIYEIQNFFVDLQQNNLSPILLAFTDISRNEIIYSLTSHPDTEFINKLKSFFTNSLKNRFQCHFNYIGENDRIENIMTQRVKKLEKNEYLNDVLRGVTKEEFFYYKKRTKLNLNDSGYFLYLYNLMDIEYTDHDLNKNIYYLVGEKLIKECQEVLNLFNGGEVFYINPTLLCIIINDTPSKSRATYQQTLQSLTKKLNEITKCKFALRYKSNYIKNITDIRIAYESLLQLRTYNFFLRDADIITFELAHKENKNIDFKLVDGLLEEIKETIYHNLEDPQLPQLVKYLFMDIIKPSLSYDLFYYCYTLLIDMVSKFGDTPNKKVNNYIIRDNPFYLSIELVCNEYINLINFLKKDPYKHNFIKSPIILQTISFIHDNYQNNITIQSISEHLNINPSYLSQIFTNEIGVSPQRYLMKYRVEKAKELIADTNMKFYLIASEVGYFDPKQFSKVFKKITGTTPTKYKNRFLKK